MVFKKLRDILGLTSKLSVDQSLPWPGTTSTKERHSRVNKFLNDERVLMVGIALLCWAIIIGIILINWVVGTRKAAAHKIG
jgi:hypothetical protein